MKNGIIDAVRKRTLLLMLPMAMVYGQNIKTGPDVDQQVPAFSLSDQQGHTHTLKSILGPKGALLVFFRSADW